MRRHEYRDAKLAQRLKADGQKDSTNNEVHTPKKAPHATSPTSSNKEQPGKSTPGHVHLYQESRRSQESGTSPEAEKVKKNLKLQLRTCNSNKPSGPTALFGGLSIAADEQPH